LPYKGVLRRLRVGDEIVVETPAVGTIPFRVAETALVDSPTALIASDGLGARLTLVTCWPFDAVVPGEPRRYRVIAERAAR
jgi:sortase A